ncbi:multidrug resistance transporter Bcr/CflA family [Vibrio astriarenae]|nr:multidrug resistance transporter Bcr/CflA family [Vibrio sp. C7]
MIAVLALLVLFSPLGIDIYLPALPEIGAEFHVEPTLVKDTITWFMIAMGVGQLFAGPLADSVGRKQVALIGASIYGVASVLAWFSSSIEWLLVARILQGLGACATSVAAFASVRDIYGAKESGKMISYLNGIICFIPAMAPILGAWLTEWFGWRANFTTMAVFALVVGLIVLVLMPSEKRSDEAVKVVNVQHYKDVLSPPELSVPCLDVFDRHGGDSWLCYRCTESVDGPVRLSMSEFTVWFTINACINIAACFIGPRFLQSLGAYRTLIIGISLLVFAAVLMAYGANNATPMAFMLPVFIASTGFAFILGAAAGQALAPFGDKAGTASALLGLFQMTGAGLLVTLTQGWFEKSSHHMVFLMLLSAPGLLVLMTQSAKRWHGETA